MKEVFTYKCSNVFVLRIDAKQGFSLEPSKAEAFESEEPLVLILVPALRGLVCLSNSFNFSLLVPLSVTAG